MTTITPPEDIAPPSGAEADVWMQEGYRDIYSPIGVVITGDDFLRCPLITVVAKQFQDGHLEEIKVEIDDAGHQPLTAEQAREMAGFVTEAAGVAEQWAGVAL